MPNAHTLTSVASFLPLFVEGQGWNKSKNDTKTSHPQITMVNDPNTWPENMLTFATVTIFSMQYTDAV